MEEKLIKNTEKMINEVIDHIDGNSIDFIYKLVKIRHMAKEDENMNYNGYNDYGRRYSNYGEEYGRRGVDSKYRGYGHLDRMYNDYGRYEYGRERYGHNEDTKRSLKYMLESMEDFARMLREDAQSQEEIQMIRETAQRIAQM